MRDLVVLDDSMSPIVVVDLRTVAMGAVTLVVIVIAVAVYVMMTRR